MDFFQLLNLVQQQYPQLVPLLTQPGVFAVVSQAINDNWPQARLQAALENTDYFKSTSQSARQMQVLQVTDPTTFARKTQDAWDIFNSLVAETGMKMGGSLALEFVSSAVFEGWDATQMRFHFLTSVNASDVGTGGSIAENAASIRGMAQEYGVTLSDKATLDWSRQLAAGMQTQDSIRGYLVEQAKSMYPQLAGALDKGITVAQYADPYKQLAVQELGINPSNFDLTDPKWQAALNQTDPKTGARVPLNLAEWQVKLRTDPTYGYDTSTQARSQVGQLATQIAQKMGAT